MYTKLLDNKHTESLLPNIAKIYPKLDENSSKVLIFKTVNSIAVYPATKGNEDKQLSEEKSFQSDDVVDLYVSTDCHPKQILDGEELSNHFGKNTTQFNTNTLCDYDSFEEVLESKNGRR
jgi:hypothetical protein